MLEELAEGDRQLIDSCLILFHEASSDTLKAKIIGIIVETSWDENVWPVYNEWLFHFIKKNHYSSAKNEPKIKPLFLAGVINNMALAKMYKGKIELAIKLFHSAIIINEATNDLKGLTDNYSNLAFIYEDQGNVAKAIHTYETVLKIDRQLNNKKGMASTLTNLGHLHKKQENYNYAIQFHKEAIDIMEEFEDYHGLSAAYNNLGSTYFNTSMLDSALYCYKKGLHYQEKVGNNVMISTLYENLGVYYFNTGKFDSALVYHQLSMDLRIKNDISDGQATSSARLADIYYIDKDFEKAQLLAEDGLKKGRETGHLVAIELNSSILSRIYEAQGKGIKSLEMYKLYVQMKDSINNEQNTKAVIHQQTQYEFEKAQIVKENEAKEQARLEVEETSRRNNLQYSLIFLGILVLFVAILMLGFIKVSPNVAEGLIFFAFLILFEFVLVFTEPYLEQYTNGEPMYNLLANSVLALLIFPVHAILEKLLKKRIVK